MQSRLRTEEPRAAGASNEVPVAATLHEQESSVSKPRAGLFKISIVTLLFVVAAYFVAQFWMQVRYQQGHFVAKFDEIVDKLAADPNYESHFDNYRREITQLSKVDDVTLRGGLYTIGRQPWQNVPNGVNLRNIRYELSAAIVTRAYVIRRPVDITARQSPAPATFGETSYPWKLKDGQWHINAGEIAALTPNGVTISDWLTKCEHDYARRDPRSY